MNDKDIETIFKTILLLFVILSANFLQHGLSCQVREHLRDNMLDKQIFIFLTTYFTVSLMDADNELSVSKRFLYSLIIFFGFIIFQRTNKYITLIVFILLVVVYSLNEKIKHDKKNNKDEDKEKLENLKKKINYVYIIACVLLLIGHLMYFRKQYKDHYEDFSYMKFYMGVLKCKSINYNVSVE